MTSHVPSRSDVYRRVAERLDPETRFQLDCYLALLARDIDRGRPDAAKANVEELRAAIREREGDRCPSP
ncbi:MAG: hypothetical protein K2X87_01080 [Gemmataceae bacterium]|nr:hypothetical protein [Gemmataceae bacterium]